MLGLSGKPKTDAEGRIIPSEAFGVKLMSMGLLLEEGTAVIWRGPMLIKSLRQMLRGVAWGELDYLFIELPPGTGDVQLTVAQQTRVDGAVIVSTPQDIALIDARKAIDMFNKTSTPIVGLVENMAMFVCPHCGGETDLFGHGGAQAEAEKTGLRFLGAIPLHAETRRSGDAGTPAAADPAHPQCAAFRAVAAAMDAALVG